MGLASLVAPPLAAVAVVCGVVAWIHTLLSPSEGGRWRTLRGVMAALVLAPIGVTIIGDYWAHRASNLVNFGSGTQISAIPIISVGPGYTVSSAHVGSDDSGAAPSATLPQNCQCQPSGSSAAQVFQVSNQTSMTTWVNGTQTEQQLTLVELAPSPSLAQDLERRTASNVESVQGASRFPVAGLPGAVGVELPGVNDTSTASETIVAGRGSVVVLVQASGSESVRRERSDLTSRVTAQLAAVPVSVATLDMTKDSYESRHNKINGVVAVIFKSDLGVVGLFLVLATVTVVVEVGRRLARFTSRRPSCGPNG